MSKSLCSKKYSQIGTGGLAESADLAKKFDDVVDFTLGDPDIITPLPIMEAALSLIHI